jgi:hypothetical protein
MPILYTTIQNCGGVVLGGKRKTVTVNYDVAKREFCEHALEWLRWVFENITSKCEIACINTAPVLMRLSDRAVLFSTVDVFPECMNAYKEFTKKSKELKDRSDRLYVERDKKIESLVAKIMIIQGANVPKESPTLASYAIVTKMDGEFAVCRSTNILSNTLESQMKEFTYIAQRWAKYGEKVIPPPFLMSLSDGVILYSVTDFAPEMQAIIDGFASETKRLEEELIQLKEAFDDKLRSLVDRFTKISLPYAPWPIV